MSDGGRLTPEQCRAARAWLDWSQQDLAGKANVSLSTVKDFESGRRSPIKNNMAAMVSALAAAGMAFTPDGLRGPNAAAGTRKKSAARRKRA
jgi:DNA-binding transcriptional regulator YiaG